MQVSFKLIKKEELNYFYNEENLTCLEISKLFNISETTVWRRLKKFNINIKGASGFLKNKPFSIEHRNNISKAKKGKYVEGTGFQKGGPPTAGSWKKGHKPVITPERNRKISIAKKGKSRPPLSKEWCANLSKSHLGMKHNKPHPLIGRIRTSAKRQGITVEEWSGFLTPLYNQVCSWVRHKINWREDVFERDNFTCRICGDNKGGNLNAHHIIGLSAIIRYYNIKSLDDARRCVILKDLNNGITLCEDCHRWIHSKQNINCEYMEALYG